MIGVWEEDKEQPPSTHPCPPKKCAGSLHALFTCKLNMHHDCKSHSESCRPHGEMCERRPHGETTCTERMPIQAVCCGGYCRCCNARCCSNSEWEGSFTWHIAAPAILTRLPPSNEFSPPKEIAILGERLSLGVNGGQNASSHLTHCTLVPIQSPSPTMLLLGGKNRHWEFEVREKPQLI